MFDGSTYSHELDHTRLTSQLERVYFLMRDGRWRTLNEISTSVSGSESSVSARLRDLRKDKFRELFPNLGVERKRDDNGLHWYRMRVQAQGELF